MDVDRPLDDLIADKRQTNTARPANRGSRPSRDRRDPVPYARPAPRSTEDKWVHDAYQGPGQNRRAGPAALAGGAPVPGVSFTGISPRIEVVGLHYEVTPADLKNIFSQAGTLVQGPTIRHQDTTQGVSPRRMRPPWHAQPDHQRRSPRVAGESFLAEETDPSVIILYHMCRRCSDYHVWNIRRGNYAHYTYLSSSTLSLPTLHQLLALLLRLLQYDRSGRSTGIATMEYASAQQAKIAINKFDGAMTKGQTISIKLLPPVMARGPPSAGPDAAAARPQTGASLLARIAKPAGTAGKPANVAPARGGAPRGRGGPVRGRGGATRGGKRGPPDAGNLDKELDSFMKGDGAGDIAMA